MSKGNKQIAVVLGFFLIISLISLEVEAKEVDLVNSQNWEDVYSVLLYSTLRGETALFLTSESIASVTRIMPINLDVNVIDSESEPLIQNLRSQLASAGYNVLSQRESNSLNLDLDPRTGNYALISDGNYRASISLASYAANNNYWVLIVNEDNVDQVVQRISTANNVLAVGNFRRDLLVDLEPYFTEWINNNNVF